jgi:hypothetical protein
MMLVVGVWLLEKNAERKDVESEKRNERTRTKTKTMWSAQMPPPVVIAHSM